MNNTFPTEGNLSGLSRKDFQKDINDKKTDLFILKNTKGMEVAVTNYGCAILSIMVPDKNGKYANVILGHDSIDHVINSPEPFLSTTIGRYGNRIAKGKFTLFGEEHELTINNGPNSLHGGPTGFHARVWDAVQIDESTVQFNYVSADGEEGFPGNLEVEMTYRLENEVNALTIEYRATTDKATVVNLTNHGFFNLAGISNPTPTVNNHIVTINADFYTPIDEVSIPTGEIAKVEGTPMDFRAPHTVGEAIKSARFAAALFEEFGFGTTPKSTDDRFDIVQSVLLRNEENLIAFCQGMQKGAPIDSFVTPEPWDMPGYDSKVIMSAGAFTGGASIELSADAPLREPYAVYMQGGLNFHSAKVGIMLAAEEMAKRGLI